MKIIHQDGFSEQELLQFRPVIYKNVLDSAKAVVLYMIKVGLECVEYSNRVSFFLVAYGLAGPRKCWERCQSLMQGRRRNSGNSTPVGHR